MRKKSGGRQLPNLSVQVAEPYKREACCRVFSQTCTSLNELCVICLSFLCHGLSLKASSWTHIFTIYML